MTLEQIKYDCRFFKGDIPCKPNKLRNKECPGCNEYDKIKFRILIIKLGAIGDVIRSTPLIHKFRKEFPGSQITWITNSPEIVPSSAVDIVCKFDFISVYKIKHQKYDIALNLDKDFEACALLQDVNSAKKFGFILKNEHISTATPDADHKLITGIFDHISIKNTKNYLEEIFEICGFKFNNEPYILDLDTSFDSTWQKIKDDARAKKIIGLNTGCGKRWQTRLWPEDYWIELIKKLQKAGTYPLLLGGPDEDIMNKNYAKKSGAYYPGTFTLQQFISLTNQCDVILSAVSMMMHIAIALKKPLILFNNIFNRNEFYLYNNGTIIEPTTGCDCYYGQTCKRQRHCMKDIGVDSVYEAILKYLEK
jgi:ADP-heptose:LPS heptosyltransferase